MNEILIAFQSAPIWESIFSLILIGGAWEGLKIICGELGRSVGWK
jgi:hypothetical protein